MEFVKRIKDICDENKNTKVGMFIDMDGVLADYDLGSYWDIRNNTPDTFLIKRPIKTIINVLEQLTKIENLDFYILSACLFENQAVDKSIWIDKYIPFIKKQNRYFIIKEFEKYTRETKPKIKVSYISKVMNKDSIDLSIYIEDEHLMLRQAQNDLKDKVICFHVSSLLD